MLSCCLRGHTQAQYLSQLLACNSLRKMCVENFQGPLCGADFDKDLVMGGVLFNKVGGEAHSQWLREALEASGLAMPVLGGIPKVCRRSCTRCNNVR